MKMQPLLTIAAFAVFGCTSGTPVPFNKDESEDETDIKTHLPNVPIEKRAVSSSKYIIVFSFDAHICYS